MLHFVYTNTGYYCESALWLNDLLILEMVITHIQYTDCTQIPCDSTKYALVSANDHLYNKHEGKDNGGSTGICTRLLTLPTAWSKYTQTINDHQL